MKHDLIDVRKLFTTFFQANHCTIEENSSHLKVKLTKEMDQALMNRPFYWHYMESTNQVGVPQTVSFSFHKNADTKDSPFVHFGCPWFQKLKKYLTEHCTLTLAYEAVNGRKKTMLQPWLLANVRMTYRGKRQKEELYSFGINLINGIIHLNMMDQLKTRTFSETITDLCYTISPVITLKSGFRRIEQHLYDMLTNKEHAWATEAHDALREEIAMLQHFYQNSDTDELLEREIEAAKKRLAPTITFSVISGGLLYLSEQFITK